VLRSCPEPGASGNGRVKRPAVRDNGDVAAEHAATFSSRWVYLWPLIAVRLDGGDLAAAAAGARQLLDPAQQRLPDELESAVGAACLAWDRGEQEACGHKLAAAAALARDLCYL
jgi:hypothetical protein